ncbi:aminotransferase class V-fold PLP-dependent enzyme [Acetobacterium malicum]|uniref:cysteine desulfurase n=1 Tax=Acetobacterium malicum TaxID=52692 RepID=A0ABR6YUF7_9FIRM|nr:aminotransferase class V-fold PLP-dependent enzyme [Acetobacterium malicum]MBC3898747.1 aminotransferase class V-fold PLP-dependent enzyme [Acetobacterium malicum]
MDIYLDNAATTFPKPLAVPEAIYDYIVNNGGTSGRGSYEKAILADGLVYQTRKSLAKLFNHDDPKTVVFTSSVTESLNLALQGILKPGDHVVTSALEHNAVWRCLKTLERDLGIYISVVPATAQGETDIKDVVAAITPDTKIIVFTHASNVLGTIQPIEAIGALAREKGILFLVDAAQTAGVIPIDVQAQHIDLLAFTGHKSLLGPMGTGGLVVNCDVDIHPLISGGTGGDSAYEYQPDYYPNHLEAGTMNVSGIIGLSAALDFLKSEGLETIRSKEDALMDYALNALSTVPGIELYGPQDSSKSVGVIPFNIEGHVPEEIAYFLDQECHVMIRSGLHCAPSAHRLIGTVTRGTCRIGIGYFNEQAHIDALVNGLKSYLKENN